MMNSVVNHADLAPAKDSHTLLKAYENIRPVLPVTCYPERFERSHDLGPLTGRYDAFFFDAFGVLNIGDTAIDKAAERISAVRRAGRHVHIVSNAASTTIPALHRKYTRLGFDFHPNEIVSSRVALIHYLCEQQPQWWGVMAPPGADMTDLGVDVVNLAEQPTAFDHVDGFILLSAFGWTEVLHERLLLSLMSRSRPVLLANPDLAAPRESGFSIEPGQIAQSLRVGANCQPIAFGKPYRAIFDIALSRLSPTISRERVLMIGDTLHTDVLGGCNAGLHTALVTSNGACAALDWADAINTTGIVPHHVLDHI